MDEVRGDLDRVDHLAFRETRVRVETFEADRHGVRGERFDLQLPQRLSVHGVGTVGAKALDVEVASALPDLLVRGKPDANGSVGDLGVGHEVFRRPHDLGHSDLVVRAEQRRSRGGDDVAAHLFLEMRVVRASDHRGRIAGQDQILPLIVLVNDRFDTSTAHLG